MGWKIFALVLTFSAGAFAQFDGFEAPEMYEEEPSIRCKRPLCETVCDIDFQLDARGCPTCECLEDPCKNKTCPTGHQCVPMPCQTYPCDKMEARCQRTMACPLRECTLECPFGWKKDAAGCELCQCKDHPCQDITCEYGERCQPHKPCSEELHCDFEPECVPDDGHEVLPGDGCSDVMCFMACQFGFLKDENGCEVCECSDDPCNNHKCPSHEICQVQSKDCDDEADNCPIYATCAAKPLCHHMQEHPDLLTTMGLNYESPEEYRVRCQPDSGEFEYMQCGESMCWCVDDRGVAIPDTRHPKPLTDEPNTCIRNRTHAVDVRFNMTHNLPNVQDHLAKLTEVTITKVTEWLSIEEDYVTGMELITKSVDIVEVHFLVVRGVDDEVDLPTAVFHLHYEIHVQKAMLNYDDQVLTPDPDSISMDHLYEPKLPASGGIRPIDSSEESSSHEGWEDGKSGRSHDNSRKHSWLYNKCFGKSPSNPVRLFVIIACLCFMLMIIIGIVCVCKRRRTKRYDMQKANLAFTNDLYGHMHKVGGEDDKVKLKDETIEEKDPEKADA